MPIAHLDQVLPHRPEGRKSDRQAVRNALSQLRNGAKLNLAISESSEPVTLSLKNSDPGTRSLNEDRAWIDLWAFFDYVEAAEYPEARALIPAGFEPKPLVEEAAHNDFWRKTFELFAKRRREVLRAIKTTTGRNQTMRDIREHLLRRSLVPGVGREVPIGSVRGRMESIGFPWKQLRPQGNVQRDPLPLELTGMLADSSGSSPKRLLIVGGGGAGKTLAAISSFLLLTDPLDDPVTAEETRLVFYIDGRNDTRGDDSEPPPASNAWYEQRLLELGADGEERPILIMSHADSFFSEATASLSEIINWRIFKECDVLLCSSETFYEDELKFTGYGDHVFRLERWSDEDQKAFASALFSRKTWRCFAAWRDEDRSGTREKLCKVPLHLSFILPLVEDQGDALRSVSTHWHLFDQLARIRLDAAHLGNRKEQLLTELAAIAHHFYVADSPDSEAIAFNRKDLEDFLRSRNRKEVEERLSIIIHDTLIEEPPLAHVDYHFEDPAWGWFFVALHLGGLLKSRQPIEPVLKAFAKPFSDSVMDLCEEILADEFGRHEERIMRSLRGALKNKKVASAMTAGQRKTATDQVAHLLRLVEAPL